MYSTKIFSQLCLIVGLILLAAGIYMKFDGVVSTAQSYTTRLGTHVNAEKIDGNGTLFFGILILILSLISNRIYFAQKIERNKKIESERISDELKDGR
jgi:hypothetical protein